MYLNSTRTSLSFTVPEDLSLEERDELSNIRRRKKELLDDIEVSQENEKKCQDFIFFIKISLTLDMI